MMALYFFGPLVEYYLGARRYLAFYLLCGMAGGAAYLLLWAVGAHAQDPRWILIVDPRTPLVGASAGIFGILIAAARIAPDARVMLLFPPIPMRLRTLAWVLLGLAAYTVIFHGANAGGQAAHLGGAAVGAVLIQFPRALNIFKFSFRRPAPQYGQGFFHQ
jgi:membrane associated rhomboid family serine protease